MHGDTQLGFEDLVGADPSALDFYDGLRKSERELAGQFVPVMFS